MKDYVNEYLASKRDSENYPVAPAMQLRRGGRLSVQASKGHYCSPKDNTGPYHMVEVLVPSPRFKVPKSWGKPAQKFNDRERLFTWVPVELVNAAIAKRGGILNG